MGEGVVVKDGRIWQIMDFTRFIGLKHEVHHPRLATVQGGSPLDFT